MSSLRTLVVALPILGLLLSSAPVSAQEAPDEDQPEATDEDQEALARQVFETGRTYFNRAEYERAVEAFREAYRLSGRAALLINVARSLEALGRNAEAIAALEQAMEEDEELRTLAEPRLARLRAQLRHDEEAGATAEDAAAGEDATGAPEAPAEDAGFGPLFWAGVASAGVGVALLATSIGTGVASNDIYGDLEASCPDRVCPPERQGDIDQGQSLAIASTATLVIGGVAAGAGVLMMLLDTGSGSADEEPAAVEVTGGPGAAGLGLRARF